MNNEKGFSLVEVSAAIVILTIVITSIYPLFSQSKDMTVRNEERLVAYHAAEAILQRAKTTPNTFFEKPIPFSELKNQSVCTTDNDKKNNDCYILINNNAYEWELTFDDVPLTETNNKNTDQALVQATVTIKNIHRLQSANIDPDKIAENVASAKTMPLNYSIEAIVDRSLHSTKK